MEYHYLYRLLEGETQQAQHLEFDENNHIHDDDYSYYYEEEPNDVYHLYTNGQKRALAFITYFVSLPSLLGSLTIVYVLLKEKYIVLPRWKRKQQQEQEQREETSRRSNHHHHQDDHAGSVYYRLLLGLSCMDILHSGGIFMFGSWAVPATSTMLDMATTTTTTSSSSPQGGPLPNIAFGARGTIGTCNAAGVALTMVGGSVMYSACLALYHVFLVRYQVSDKTIAKYWEPWFHLISITTPIAVSIVAVVKNYMNPLHVLSGYCWIGDWPPRCSIHPLDETNYPNKSQQDEQCIRGDGYAPFSRYVNLVVFGFTFLCILVCMVLIVLKVYATEKRLRQYGFGTNAAELKLTKAAGTQGLLYVGSFLICFVWTVILSQMTHLDGTPRQHRQFYFPLAFLAKCFGPLQGTFNVFIFLHTRYEKLSQEGKSLYVVRQCVHRISAFRPNAFGTGSATSAAVANSGIVIPATNDAGVGRTMTTTTTTNTNDLSTTKECSRHGDHDDGPDVGAVGDDHDKTVPPDPEAAPTP